MTITAATIEDLQAFAQDATLSGFYWHNPAASWPAQTLEGAVWFYSHTPSYPDETPCFPLTLEAHSLTSDGIWDFREAFLEEAGSDLLFTDAHGVDWNASSPWDCPGIVEEHGQWLDLSLSPAEMGRAWARNLLSQMEETA